MFSTPEYNPFKRLFSFGWNSEKKLGVNSDAENVGTPILIDNLSDRIRCCALGGSHSIVVTDDNRVFSVGNNTFGQLGVGDANGRDKFTQIPTKCFPPSSDPIVQVACGDQYSVALTKEGNVFCWGKNFVGQLGFGQDRSDVLTPKRHEVLSAKSIKRIACGSRHTLLLDDKGSIYAMGYGKFGQLGLGTYGNEIFVKKIDGKESGGPEFDAIEIKAKSCCSIALSRDYEVYFWGGKKYEEEERRKRENQPCVPRKIFGNLQGRRIVDIAVSSHHGLALTSDGSVYGFGYFLSNLGYTNHIGRILDSFRTGSEVTSSTQEIKDMNLDLSKRYILNGEHGFKLYKNHFIPPNEVIGISCGECCNYAWDKSGNVWVWGKGSHNELGFGEEVEILVPKQIPFFKEKNIFVASVVPGLWHCICLEGNINNFQHRHLNVGQRIPKCLDRLPTKREEEEEKE